MTRTELKIALLYIMVYNYGMAKMNKRTTFALDEETIQRLRKLALLWHVSQAEVVRKAVEMAESEVEKLSEAKLNSFYLYHKKHGLTSAEADEYLNEVAENRSDWGR